MKKLLNLFLAMNLVFVASLASARTPPVSQPAGPLPQDLIEILDQMRRQTGLLVQLREGVNPAESEEVYNLVVYEVDKLADYLEGDDRVDPSRFITILACGSPEQGGCPPKH